MKRLLLVALFSCLAGAAQAGDGATMWTVEGAKAYAGFAGRDCALEEFDDPERALVPAGLRGEGRRVEHSCGGSYIRLELPGELHGRRWLITREEHVSPRAPRASRWDQVASQGTGWMRDMASSKHRIGIPLDRPDWTVPLKMRPGESFEILDPRLAVVRTVAGREVLLSPFAVLAQDPLAGKRERQAARDAWERGRAARTAERPITPVPPAAELLADRSWLGAVFEVELDTDDVDHERFVDAWLDPVGQLLEHACDDKPDEAEPCGAYWLDYGALGAWWPERDTEILALFEGTETVEGRELPRLLVLVRAPWKETRPVAPAWADAP